MSVRILNCDVLEGLKQISDESVHMVCTSPPYFGLRSYLPDDHPQKMLEVGLEASPEAYIAHMVEIFREVRRTLRDDGSLWVNIGDSFCSTDKWGGGIGGNTGKQIVNGDTVPSWAVRKKRTRFEGIKPKDLIGIPWMLAFALRADGWWLRRDIIWAKANGMPDSAEDRAGSAHEYIFHLTKSATYYYDHKAVRLPPMPESVGRLARAMRKNLGEGSFVVSGGGYAPPGQPPHQGARARASDKQRGHGRRHAGFNDRWDAMERAQQQSEGAGLRSVWWLAPGGFPEAHFATMPEELAAACILAGCPEGGVVLDPFSGAGTTIIVGDRLKRDAIGIEINSEYVEMSERRLARDRLERGVGTMTDVKAAKLDPTPLEALMMETGDA